MTATLLSSDIVRGDHGERLVCKHFSNSTVTYDWWWAEFVPDLTTDVRGESDVPEYIDPSEDMSAALAAVFIRALLAPGGVERLPSHQDDLWVDRPEWETGVEGLTAFSNVLRVFERKGFGIGCTPSKFLLYRR